jgi:hypothetical protein
MMRSMLRRVPVKKVVDADDIGAVLEQAFAQMRAEKSGATGHNHACFEMHVHKPLKSGLLHAVLA